MVLIQRYTKPLVDLHDYVVYDTETTGVNPASDKIIQYALATVENDRVVSNESGFVDPGCSVPASASNVNHIYDSDLVGAPSYSDIAPLLADRLIGKVVIAHNAPFDMRITKALFDCGNYAGTIYYVDTLFYARNVIPGMPNYKLQTLASELGFDSGDAHRADSDVLTCHQLFQYCKQHTVDRSFSQDPGAISNEAWVSASDFSPTSDPPYDSQLLGKTVVFTGLFKNSRPVMCQMAVNAGAILKDKVTTQTDYLVVGKPNPQYFSEHGKTRKVLDAEDFNARGKGNIKFIKEADFKRMCGSVQTVSENAADRQSGCVDQGEPSSPAKPKRIVSKILQWIFFAAALFLGLLFIPSYSSVLFAVSALSFLPVRFVDGLFDRLKVPRAVRFVIAVIALLIGLFLIPHA